MADVAYILLFWESPPRRIVETVGSELTVATHVLSDGRAVQDVFSLINVVIGNMNTLVQLVCGDD